MHTFDHHNGVVHHNGDGQHHGREGEQVDGEADEVECEEGTYQGHGDGNSGYEGTAEVLQEEEHHDKHEDEGFDKRLDHFVDRGKEEVVHALCHLDFQSFGKVLLAVGEQGFHVFYNLRSVGACNLHHDARYRAVTVYATGEGVGRTAKFHTGHVLHPDHVAVGRGADDHVLKFRRLAKATFVAEGVLEGLVLALADVARCSLNVLFGEYARDVRGHEVVFGHLFGVEPDTHGVVGAHHHGVAHTLHALHLGNDVDFRVVLDEVRFVLVRSVHDRENHEHGALALLRNHTDAGYFRGEQTLCLRNAVLHVHGGHVGVGALLEGDLDGSVTRVGGGGRHVVHVFHTVHLLLDGGNHGVQHSLGIGTRVRGANLYRRRCNVGVLRNGERNQAQHTQDDDYH